MSGSVQRRHLLLRGSGGICLRARAPSLTWVLGRVSGDKMIDGV